MNTTTRVFSLPGIQLPELTHQRVQELKQTKKGQLILRIDLASFPELLKFMENALGEQLTRFEQLKRTTENSNNRKLLLMALLEEYLFMEFTRHIMFIKWREERIRKAS